MPTEEQKQRARERAKAYYYANQKHVRAQINRWRAENRDKVLEYSRRYDAKPEQKRKRKEKYWNNVRAAKDYQLRKHYGIGIDQFEIMVAMQSGCCALCQKPPRGGGSNTKVLHVDHDHETKIIRGLLCHPCNTAIGLLGEEPGVLERAIEYLKKGR